MKKFTATIIFYAWTDSSSNFGKLEKLQKFLRREHLLISGDKLECLPYRLNLPGVSKEIAESLYQLNQSPISHEHRYWIVLEYAQLEKLHKATALVQAYAFYIGVNSRIFSMKAVG